VFGKLPDVAKCIGREHVAAIADKLSKIGVAPCGFTFHATCFNARRRVQLPDEIRNSLRTFAPAALPLNAATLWQRRVAARDASSYESASHPRGEVF